MDNALKSVPAPAKAELDQLSEQTREDLRLQLLQSLEQSEREVWSSVLAMQSSEKTGDRLVIATWGLVFATVGLVKATVVLVWVTLAGEHPSQAPQPAQSHSRPTSQPQTRTSG